ncbi:MAG TPA: sigma-70 family RNA polymerase sigma factor [Puia sp.]|nr:sigma-70 family RNA polymerase sigma factor [Puia sp.]
MDRTLTAGLLQGGIHKRRAEEQLFTSYAYFIKEGIKKYSLQEEDAFDAYSDSVLSAIEKITNGSFESRSSLKTYLYQIFHNKCVDLLRKKTTNKYSVHKTLSIKESLFDISDAARSVIQRLVDKSDWAALRQKLDVLGDNCRKALLLWADGHSDQEIATFIDYKTAAVAKTSRIRCLEKLRQLYKAP